MKTPGRLSGRLLPKRLLPKRSPRRSLDLLFSDISFLASIILFTLFLSMISMIIQSSLVSCEETSQEPSEELYRFERMWPILQQPWYFKNPEGIAIDRQGYVYVADTGNDRVQKFTADGQFVVKWNGGENEDGGENEEDRFWGPYDLALDSGGFVYVTDTNKDRIQKFTSHGSLVSRWGSRGSQDGQFNHPYAIAVDTSRVDDGFVYVADTDNHRIQKFSLDGRFLTKWGKRGTGEGEFNQPRDIAIDSSGFVYVVDTENHRIQKFTSQGQFVAAWGKLGSGDGQFDHPIEITIDSSGFIYVCDPYNQRIQKFTPDGKFVTKWGSKWGASSQDGEFSSPYGIVTDRSGFVYVADSANQRIQKFTSDGRFITKWANTGSGEGEFHTLQGVVTDRSGCVYVADSFNNRIQKFSPDGLFRAQWGTYGCGNGEFDWPIDVAVDSSGFVYVVDRNNNRIQKFTPDGRFSARWGKEGSRNGEFKFPSSIAIDSGRGFIYVADSGNYRVQKFDLNGRFLAKWGRHGSRNGQFGEPGGEYGPFGLAVDSSGFVYVADPYNFRIQKFDSQGRFITTWGKFGFENDQLDHPKGIAIDSAGLVYVADAWFPRIQIFDPNGEYITQFGESGTDPGQLNGPCDLFIGPDDRIYVANTDNHVITVFIKKPLASQQAKAIIVAGGGPYPGNNLWDATQICANFAYRSLTYRGFTKRDIYYLSANTILDLDNNGLFDDVDADVSSDNLHKVITECASAGKVSDVVLYLADHGGNDTFRLSSSQILTASDLDTWLDALQETISGKVIVIYDACESGSFIPSLMPPDGKERIVITSTSSGENANFVTEGSISFSSFFLTHILHGENIKDAFDLASESVKISTKHQTPLLDDNGNPLGNEPEDGILAQKTHIGTDTGPAAPNQPLVIIGSVSPPQTIKGTGSALLYAEDIASNDGLARVWTLISPPQQGSQELSSGPSTGLSASLSSGSLTDLPSLDLMPAGENRYEATYDGFNRAGTYQIALYARDRAGNTSVPKLTSVTVEDPLARKAILVAGGPQSDTLWPAIEKSASLAYCALTFQGYSDDDIYFLSPSELSSGFDNLPTLNNLHYAIETWAGDSTQELVVYLVGNAGNETFRINGEETLSAYDLDVWLDNVQDTISGTVTVIFDACQSGSFLPLLLPPVNPDNPDNPANKERIVISSTGPNEPAYFLSNGDISFSAFFWRQILNGASVRDAFVHGVNALGSICQSQVPMLDDNGNGVGNETGIDGRLARNYSIGSGIVQIDDAPLIGTVSPDQTLGSETSATIWVEEVTTTGKIEKVWAIIAPPASALEPPGLDSSGNPVTDLPSLTLAYNGCGRYEGIWDGFTLFGTYRIAVYATDEEGNISLQVETSIRKAAGPDTYEQDNSPDQARVIVLNESLPQTHNFHEAGDQDWVKFYGISGQDYVVRVNNTGSNCDAVISLYDQDGKTLLKGPWSWEFEGEDEYMNWTCSQGGIYYVMVRHLDPGTFGENTGYDLIMFCPAGPFPGLIKGTIKDAHSGVPIEGALVTTDSGGSGISISNGMYVICHPAGTFTVRAQASGYDPLSHRVVVLKLENVTCNFSLEPGLSTFDSDEDGAI